ncbi:Ger(x)C family spore germination protein [Shouchella shacheensis]|uniref:Ger(x)C family spore germination protein n=1 Tax=Shouchella shacheensis TaxID=1649580 RepID=UPI000740131E|nr:Ger(x)C family spore germination protein [Shouchella shacheensis]
MNGGANRTGLLSLLILLFPLLSGCWDSVDIENRATVLGLAIDEAEPGAEQEEDKNISHLEGVSSEPKGELIRLTAQVAVPGRIPLGPGTGGGEGGGEESEPVWVLSVVGHTLDDAFNNLQQEVAEELFLGQLRVIVISEEVAQKGVNRFNDSLRRNPKVRRTAWMVVSKEKAGTYMNIAPQLEPVPTLYLSNMVENSVDLGKFPEDSIGLFWRRLSSKGQDPFLPYLEIKAGENVQINGLAYFKGDQMIGTIDPIQIGIYMGLAGHREGGYGAFVPIPGTDTQILDQPYSRQTRIKTTIQEGKPSVKVKLRYELVLDEKIEETIDLSDSHIIEKIEEKGSEEIADSAEELIAKMQEEGSDIFGLGEYIRAKHPGYWNQEIETKERWQEVYKDIEVDIECTYYIRRVGMKAK